MPGEHRKPSSLRSGWEVFRRGQYETDKPRLSEHDLIRALVAEIRRLRIEEAP